MQQNQLRVTENWNLGVVLSKIMQRIQKTMTRIVQTSGRLQKKKLTELLAATCLNLQALRCADTQQHLGVKENVWRGNPKATRNTE
jgi:hypothetical protein